MSLIPSYWDGFIQKLGKENNPVLYPLLKYAKIISIDDEKIVLSVVSSGPYDFLTKRVGEIEQQFFNFSQKKIKLDFIIKPPTKKNIIAPLLSFEPSIEDVFAKAGLNKKYSIENFAVSTSNQVAYAAAQAVIENPGSAYNPLFLYGGVGVGKTHIAQSVAKKILEKERNKKIYFCPGDNFTNELIEAIRGKTTGRFRQKYRFLNLLIVDDIQFIAGKNAVQEEFFHTFNAIVSSGGQIILTADRPPNKIKNLEDRLLSRFLGGLTVDIQDPDFELRSAILLIKAKEKNINIDIEAVKIIAERITDCRGLEGALLSIYAKIFGVKEQIDLEDVESFFSKDKITGKKRVNPVDIIKTVCSFYNIKQSHLKGPSRAASIAFYRQITMYLLEKELGLTLIEVAELLNRRDHTTALHAKQKISNLILRNPNLKKEVDIITQSLFQST
ncbi:chromosomal replication initiator protein DnaA [Candidatus Roizmanbacteria bacterium CG11_big_fil_rev_8_21_14_0_20_37_16]|uniref:Chromosomal replication initiator protein DnaA n=1 Tax=Candidatus Roizmanbacteria bacterium CG11_big_fil_rev_8_21_14_0_20_37_16 TaxID=1974857 RepID=A0A2H0KJV4_9BACT|nr:MAG: chromosomal replication initiator protein DnaA [Candidatus Roizmanbacteria bacterium CG11_big_fil_rev_8_21_14_0_20_37_16]